jgi:putative ATP-dependent endonuclease of OLD family
LFLKKVYLENFRKFKNADIELNKGTNLIIGQNGSGKSTLLQAIDITLNQRGNGEWRNGNEYGTLLNIEAKKDFLNNFKQGKNDASFLPSIKIELFFDDETPELRGSFFDGVNNSLKNEKSGIYFTYEFDDTFIDEYDELVKDIELDFIPFEFYRATWKSFSGETYNFRKNPFKSILIDTDKVKGDSFSNFTRQVFLTLENEKQHKLSLSLKKHINDFNFDIEREEIGVNKLGIDSTRLAVKDVLDVFDAHNKELLLRDEGSGEENIIKTDLAMSSNDSKLILLEEPENHLSFDSARKQITKIEGAESEDRQVIITTHSPLLVSKLRIDNIKWLTGDERMVSFEEIPEDTVEFFLKADNIDILQIILAKKVILVEGATEYILMANMIENVFNKTPEECGMHIVSMAGNYYSRFEKIAEITKNKVLVITDNDGNKEKIEKASKYNSDNFHVAIQDDINDFTFEVALYNNNVNFFKGNTWNHRSSAEKWKDHEGLDKELIWLLNNKAQAAFEYGDKFKSKELAVPGYIKRGLEWL